jgi:hypothetical protein
MNMNVNMDMDQVKVKFKVKVMVVVTAEKGPMFLAPLVFNTHISMAPTSPWRRGCCY